MALLTPVKTLATGQTMPPTNYDLNDRVVGPEFAHRNNPITGDFDWRHPTVIALDPGETTGWSLVRVSNAAIANREEVHENILRHLHGQVDCGRSQGALDIHSDVNGDPGLNPDGEARGVARLMLLIDKYPGSAILIEDFILDHSKAKKDRSSLSPVRVTARLEQELWHRNRVAHRQTPSMAKSTMTDDRLKELGFYQRAGGMNHARDADRHAITFLRRAQLDADLRHRAWPHLFDPVVVKKRQPKKTGKPAGERIVLPLD